MQRVLTTIEEAWSIGVSFEDDERVANVAENFLQDRSLANLLYRRLLGLVDVKRTEAEYRRLFLERLDTIDQAKSEVLTPFQISGIDALYLGHNFLPNSVTTGNCHFLDTYRGEDGDKLSLACVSEF